MGPSPVTPSRLAQLEELGVSCSVTPSHPPWLEKLARLAVLAGLAGLAVVPGALLQAAAPSDDGMELDFRRAAPSKVRVLGLSVPPAD